MHWNLTAFAVNDLNVWCANTVALLRTATQITSPRPVGVQFPTLDDEIRAAAMAAGADEELGGLRP